MFTFVYEAFKGMFLVVSGTEWAVKSRFDVCIQYATLPKLAAYFQSPKILERPQPPNDKC